MSEEDQQEENFVEFEEGALIRDTWGVIRLIGKGAYGHVYHVINVKTGVQGALKAESKAQEERVLKMERDVLQGFKGMRDTLQLISMGTTDTYSYIVMTLCGADLTKICTTVGTLSDGTLLRVAVRTLLALKQLHEIGFVHRDIKPCNFAVSAHIPRVIHILDFGMTRKYAAKNERNEWFIKRKRTHVSFRGTLRYCSVAVHNRLEQGRVDDLWSWAYMMVELRDPLPWAHLTHPETVQAVKEETSIEKLCSTGISQIFVPIMKHFEKLGYFDRPDYQMIFNTILEEIGKRNVKFLYPYDWEGKISEPGVAEKVAEVCEQLGVKCSDVQGQAAAQEQTEDNELTYLRQAFAPHPEDVPGGEQFEEKRRKLLAAIANRSNTDASAINTPQAQSSSKRDIGSRRSSRSRRKTRRDKESAKDKNAK